MESKKVAVIPLDEESKGVRQVLANDTSRKILDLISDEPLSAMHIAYRTNIAINTAQYNLEKLEKAGLVEVTRVEKSKKGRKVKIYAPTNKIIAIVPKGMDLGGIREAFRGIVPLFIAALLIAVGIDILAYSPQTARVTTTSVPQAPALGAERLMDAAAAMPMENYTANVGNQTILAGAVDDSEGAPMVAPAAAPEAEEAAKAYAPQEPIWEPPVEVTQTVVYEDRGVLERPGLWALIGGLAVVLVAFVFKARFRRR